MEFRFLERITLHEDHAKNLRVIQLPTFKNFNRYGEVLPFKHSQVEVCDPQNSVDTDYKNEDQQLAAYINASYINGLVRHFHSKSLIAAQAPTENSLTRFWKMIWQNKVRLIVMLCPLMGPKQEECMNYWRDLKEIGQTATIDNTYNLKLISSEKIGRLTKSSFEVTVVDDILSTGSGPFDPANQKPHVLDHIWDSGWEDNTAHQDEETFEAVEHILNEMFKHRDILTAQENAVIPPILVHCSAGFGRTGTICALFNMIEAIRYTKKNREELAKVLSECQYLKEKYPEIINEPVRVSIFGCVRKLREQRMLMVKK